MRISDWSSDVCSSDLAAEIQALYSRAIGPYFNLQAGVRHDFEPSPSRTYATVGFEGLAPYMFEVEGAAFLSTKGDLLGRLEGYYDQRITQRLKIGRASWGKGCVSTCRSGLSPFL